MRKSGSGDCVCVFHVAVIVCVWCFVCMCSDLFSLCNWHLEPKLHIYACITQTTQMTLFWLCDSDKRDSVLFFDLILVYTQPPCSHVRLPAYDTCASSLAIAALVLA